MLMFDQRSRAILLNAVDLGRGHRTVFICYRCAKVVGKILRGGVNQYLALTENFLVFLSLKTICYITESNLYVQRSY